MCGRYTETITEREYSRFIRDIMAAAPREAPKPRYNIAPSQLAPVIRVVDGERTLEDLKWGYYESWWATLGERKGKEADKDKVKKKSAGFRPQINARGETVFTNGLFKNGAKSRRCLVLASGWYEWTDEKHGETPHYFHLKSDELLTFAGIWTRTKGKDDKMQENFAIVTTEANPAAAKVHKRMPVILNEKGRELWLSADADAQPRLEKLLVPYKSRDLEIYPVSTYVNSPKNTGIRCIENQH